MKRFALAQWTVLTWMVISVILQLLLPGLCYAADPIDIPGVSITLDSAVDEATGQGASAGIKIMLFFTALGFLPTILLSTTCFTRIAVVLSMTRTAIGVQQAPPNMVLTGLALFLTVTVMSPVFSRIYDEGVQPYLDGTMGEKEAFEKGSIHLKKFLVANTREKDIALFLNITGSEQPEEVEDVSLTVAIPSFVVSELNTAFQIGFLIALPFLVLDMVVASVLTSMSMITLPPVVISLPLKLMMFVAVDGWSLIISSLVKTYVTS